MIYLDNAATTPLSADVLQAMEPWFHERAANPSSVHGAGVRAAEAVDRARRRVGRLAAATTWDVIFTSGGTESNALAILGTPGRGGSRRMITTTLEHPSVLQNAMRLEQAGVEVITVAPGPHGVVDPERIIDAVDARTAMVSIMHANNEIGTMQPVADVAVGVKSRNPDTIVHVDAVQTAGKDDLDRALALVDLVSISGHKMHAPMGVGALLVRRGCCRPTALFGGGGQQWGVRPGTENLPGIVGLGQAARRAADERKTEPARLRELVDHFTGAFEPRGWSEMGFTEASRLPGHAVVLLHGHRAEPVVHAMHERGFVISAGSACHSRQRRRSHVLEATGLPPEVDAIRIVASRQNTADQMRQAGEALTEVLTGQRNSH